MSAPEPRPFDPLTILAALERRRVAYVLIGGLARVIHGTDEITNGVDICPQLRPENLERLQEALDDIAARDGRKVAAVSPERLSTEVCVRFRSPSGVIGVIATPAGSRGYDDLRRKATREPVGGGIRTPVADPVDLARLASATGRGRDMRASAVLRRQAELDPSVGR